MWMTIRQSCRLSEPMRVIVDIVIQHNGYFGYLENVLLSMLSGDRQHVRELGIRRILRACKQGNCRIRFFQIPLLNFEAEVFTELIDWQSFTVTESPATESMSGSDLQRLVRSDEAPIISFPLFPATDKNWKDA